MTSVSDDAQALIETIERDNPDVVNLARVVSLAVRVEPELLRRARIKLLPQVHAGAEADLWFSPLAQSQTPLWMVLLPEVTEVLRRRLAENQKELADAWRVLQEFRLNASPTISLEEEVTWLALSDDRNAGALIQKRLEEVLVSLTGEDRPGLARWAVRALPLLPATARSSQAARVISVIAGAKIGKPQILEENPSSNVLKKWLRLAAPQGFNSSSIGVRLLERVDGGATQRAVEFSDPPAVESHAITVPKTDPFPLEVTWEDQSGQHHEQVGLPARQTRTCNVGTGQIRIRTALGETHLLLSGTATEDSEDSSVDADALPASVPRAQHPIIRRAAIIEKIKDELSRANQPVVLLGPGGCGKTTLAAEVAREMVGIYRQRIVWINPQAHAAFSFPAMLNEIASQLGRADLRRLSLERAQRETAVRELIVQSPVLIVLDGLGSVPRKEQGRCLRFLSQLSYPVLITSRQRIGHARTIAVDRFSHVEAERFLEIMGKALSVEEIPKGALDRRKTPSSEAIIRATAGNPLLMRWLLVLLKRFRWSSFSHISSISKNDIAIYVFEEITKFQPREETFILMALTSFVPDAPRDAVERMVSFSTELRGDSIRHLHENRFIKATADGRRLAVEGLMRELAGRYVEAKRPGVGAKGGDFRFASNSMFHAFVDYHLGLAESNLRLSEQALDALEAEKESLLNAVNIAFKLSEWEKVIRLAHALNPQPGAGFLYQRGYWDEALAVNEQALHAARRNKDEVAQFEFMRHTASIHQQREEWETALSYYSSSMRIAEKHRDREGVAECLYQIGRIWHVTSGNKMAEKFYRQSLEVSKGLKSTGRMALVTHELAHLAHQQGKWAEARRLYVESLRLFEKSPLPDRIQDMARATLDLGILAHETGNLMEAQDHFEHSLKLLEGTGYQHSISLTLHELGRLAFAQDRMTDAERYYNVSLEIGRELDDQHSIARNLFELGRLKQAYGDRDAAQSLYLQSMNVRTVIEDKHGMASTLLQLGALAQEEERLPEAHQYSHNSLKISRELRDERGMAQAQYQLGLIIMKQGNAGVAVKLLRSAMITFKSFKLPLEAIKADLAVAQRALRTETLGKNRTRKATKSAGAASHSRRPTRRVSAKKRSARSSKSSSMPFKMAARTSPSRRPKASSPKRMAKKGSARTGLSKSGLSVRPRKLAKK